MKDAQLTQPQKALLAAGALPAEFHESDLTVAVWRADPATFGLRTREAESADNNKVRTMLVGPRGLVARGLFEKVGEYKYRLTPAGRRHAADLAAGKGVGENLVRPNLSRRDQSELARLLATRVFLATAGGMADLINRGDIDVFWNGAGPTEVTALVDRAGAALVGGCLPMSGRRTVRARELDVLEQANQILAKRFKRQPVPA